MDLGNIKSVLNVPTRDAHKEDTIWTNDEEKIPVS